MHLTGGDGVNWALDEDLRLAREALRGIAEFVELEDAEVVHCIWWERLLAFRPEDLAGKRVICQVPNRPYHYLSQPRFSAAMERVGCTVVVSSEALGEMRDVGLPCRLVPYLVDPTIFTPLSRSDARLAELVERWGIPADRYLIGNFHRDTEGGDLRSPKIQKGPDVFVEIARSLQDRGLPIHVLLAGPRRFWIRRALEGASIPSTFVGESVHGRDDLAVNTLPRSHLNLLYNLLDLCVVTSRWEGGPHTVMEAAASRCKIVSTRVGVANDVLEPASLYSSFPEAVSIVESDVENGVLEDTLDPQRRRVLAGHVPESARLAWQQIYAELDSVPIHTRALRPGPRRRSAPNSRVGRLVARIARRVTARRPVVSLWHKYFKPPYGGGNQFMLALDQGLRQRGMRVLRNKASRSVDAYVLNSVHFDVDRFRMLARDGGRISVLHRIDGPIHLYRGKDRELDELCFRLNAEFASATVLQSAWTYRQIVAMGYQPIRPVIIPNAADPAIFHGRGRVEHDAKRKVRLISTSWSDNPRKGGAIYKWIEDHLDWDRFDYTFVGRASVAFSRIDHREPVGSNELAELLRQHDVYITASENDPCSNALVEALSCGLPALYLDSGGHRELVGAGGLGFTGTEDVLTALDEVVARRAAFQRLITAPTLEQVVSKYRTLLSEIAA